MLYKKRIKYEVTKIFTALAKQRKIFLYEILSFLLKCIGPNYTFFINEKFRVKSAAYTMKKKTLTKLTALKLHFLGNSTAESQHQNPEFRNNPEK